ncbi:hypothetical protein DQ04_01681040 [Trypanosoma grayi]|uniref:hypothetical protein n=1 Tax=Trypanosoma grayi TaxID=71804 RepID=UPI0004F4250E|nr:hypothetical protein DQ04_01681040 [Trypanosoma grayi]KEG12474.1 hypothetical protein DQ04_01681040 [Trypanosoma grayi]
MAAGPIGNGKGDERHLQHHHDDQQPQYHHRTIWGRLAIAETPYPVIAADDVAISLYANRILFRVAPSTFTVTVFLRDVTRFVFFAEENSIEIQVAREDGGSRAYIVTCQEPGVALMLYDVMLPLLPNDAADSSLGQAVTLPTYTTDYPFLLLSLSMMEEAGFYELCPRSELAPSARPLNLRSPTTRLFFPTKQRVLLPSGKPPGTLANSLQERLAAPRESPQAIRAVPPRHNLPAASPKEISRRVESLQRGSEGARTGSLKEQKLPLRSEPFAEDGPQLVMYDVVSGEQIYDSGSDRPPDTPSLLWVSPGLGDTITPSSSPPSRSKSPNSAGAVASPPTQQQEEEEKQRQQQQIQRRSGASYLYTLTPAEKSPLVQRQNVTPGAFRIGSGIVGGQGSRSISPHSHWCGVASSPVPLRLPERSPSEASLNQQAYSVQVGYGPTAGV